MFQDFSLHYCVAHQVSSLQILIQDETLHSEFVSIATFPTLAEAFIPSDQIEQDHT